MAAVPVPTSDVKLEIVKAQEEFASAAPARSRRPVLSCSAPKFGA
jgi:hypothetical protein